MGWGEGVRGGLIEVNRKVILWRLKKFAVLFVKSYEIWWE